MEKNRYFIRFTYSWVMNAITSINMKSESSDIFMLSDNELENIKSIKSFINSNNKTFHNVNENFTFLYVDDVLIMNKL